MVTDTTEVSDPENEAGIPSAQLFERLCNCDMRKEFLRHRSKRSSSKEFDALSRFILSDACVEDLQTLLAGNFNYPPPRRVQLRKGHSDRRRTVYIYPERQQSVMKYITWGMLEYDEVFSPSLYSFRRNKGVADVFRSITQANYARDLYVAKADVHDYGHSIRPDLLKPMLEAIVGPRDPALYAFLTYMLDRGEYLADNRLVRGNMGGLPGIPMGSFFNNVYLRELDSVLDSQSVLYCRYADDIAVFTTTRAEAQDALTTVRCITEGLGLTLNEDKSRIIEPGEEIELLGIEIRDGNLDVSDHTIAKARTKLTHYANKLVRLEQREGLSRHRAAQMMAHRIDRYFYHAGNEEHELSWRDFFFRVLTRPDSLHGLDLVCQDLIRRVATGKRGNARYRFRYEDIKALGYSPLEHEYYSYRKEMKNR